MGMPDPGQARENVVERPRHFGRQFRQFRQFQQFSAGCFLLKVMIRSWCLFLNNRIISDNITTCIHVKLCISMFFMFEHRQVHNEMTFGYAISDRFFRGSHAASAVGNQRRYLRTSQTSLPLSTQSYVYSRSTFLWFKKMMLVMKVGALDVLDVWNLPPF